MSNAPESSEHVERTVVLKLGGSVITDKDRPETLDAPALDSVCDAVAGAIADGAIGNLVLVHGGGSFGHHHASEHGMTTTDGTHDATAVMDVHGAMTTLNQFVLDRLHERSVEAVPVHPLSVGSRTAGVDGELRFPIDSSRTLLEEGFIPVLHGDVVATSGAGATVVSGDELVVSLARELEATRVGLCSTVPGVLDGGDVIETIDSIDAVADVLGASDSTDVSGGMAAKVRELLALEPPAFVFGPADLDAFLRGSDPGTRIE